MRGGNLGVPLGFAVLWGYLGCRLKGPLSTRALLHHKHGLCLQVSAAACLLVFDPCRLRNGDSQQGLPVTGRQQQFHKLVYQSVCSLK